VTETAPPRATENVTGYAVAGPDRPDVEAFVGFLRDLHARGLVVPGAAVAAGDVTDQREVCALDDPGKERTIVWRGTSVDELCDAVRGVYATGDVTVYFREVTARAFARPICGDRTVPGDDLWDCAGTRAPSLCVYSVRSPLKVSRTRPVPGEGRSLGRSGCWAALDGPDMQFLWELLNDSRLHERMHAAFGKIRVGDEEW
jgi:hypothetical protein